MKIKRIASTFGNVVVLAVVEVAKIAPEDAILALMVC